MEEEEEAKCPPATVGGGVSEHLTLGDGAVVPQDLIFFS